MAAHGRGERDAAYSHFTFPNASHVYLIQSFPETTSLPHSLSPSLSLCTFVFEDLRAGKSLGISIMQIPPYTEVEMEAECDHDQLKPSQLILGMGWGQGRELWLE